MFVSTLDYHLLFSTKRTYLLSYFIGKLELNHPEKKLFRSAEPELNLISLQHHMMAKVFELQKYLEFIERITSIDYEKTNKNIVS